MADADETKKTGIINGKILTGTEKI